MEVEPEVPEVPEDPVGALLDQFDTFVREGINKRMADARKKFEPKIRKLVSKRKPRRKAALGPDGKPVAKGGLMQQQQLSKELASFVGKEKASRTEVVSALWVYIKAKNLQDAQDKRQITLDSKLGKLLGTEHTDMWRLQKLVSPHFIKAK